MDAIDNVSILSIMLMAFVQHAEKMWHITSYIAKNQRSNKQ